MIKKIILGIFILTPIVIFGKYQDAKNLIMNNRSIDVPEVFFNTKPSIEQIDSMFLQLNAPSNYIDIQNWKDFNYDAQIKFKIAYSKTEIYLQFIVNEPYVKATYKKDEGAAPYKDSCVEFFILPDNKHYYNLELNCIGKGTFAGGSERTNRTKYGKEIMDKILRSTSLSESNFLDSDIIKSTNSENKIQWKMTIAMPLEVFTLEEVNDLKGKSFKANFYKCGDDMPIRHYFSWNPIPLEKPNFHVPQFFGTLNFK